MSSEVKLDSVVTAVIQKFQQRAEFGQKKYGTNLDRTDLGVLDWIQHAQEEHMDAILYLEKLKQYFPQPPLTQTTPVQTTPLPPPEEPKKTVVVPESKEDDKHMTHWGC